MTAIKVLLVGGREAVLFVSGVAGERRRGFIYPAIPIRRKRRGARRNTHRAKLLWKESISLRFYLMEGVIKSSPSGSRPTTAGRLTDGQRLTPSSPLTGTHAMEHNEECSEILDDSDSDQIHEEGGSEDDNDVAAKIFLMASQAKAWLA